LLKHVNTQLAEHEQLHMLVIVMQPWTIENGCLTPTMKVKRSRIEAYVHEHVDSWYASNKPVIWG
jgi:long-chain acyl-CoA synthetase